MVDSNAAQIQASSRRPGYCFCTGFRATLPQCAPERRMSDPVERGTHLGVGAAPLWLTVHDGARQRRGGSVASGHLSNQGGQRTTMSIRESAAFTRRQSRSCVAAAASS